MVGSQNSAQNIEKIAHYTAIPYRVSTGPEQGFPCVLFPNREKPVFITGIPANGNRFFPVRKSTQGKPCFHYRDGFAVYVHGFEQKSKLRVPGYTRF